MRTKIPSRHILVGQNTGPTFVPASGADYNTPLFDPPNPFPSEPWNDGNDINRPPPFGPHQYRVFFDAIDLLPQSCQPGGFMGSGNSRSFQGQFFGWFLLESMGGGLYEKVVGSGAYTENAYVGSTTCAGSALPINPPLTISLNIDVPGNNYNLNVNYAIPASPISTIRRVYRRQNNTPLLSAGGSALLANGLTVHSTTNVGINGTAFLERSP